MKNHLRKICIGIGLTALMLSCTPMLTQAHAHLEFYQQIKKACHYLTVQLKADHHLDAVLPGRIAELPKNRVMLLTRYFGMLVGADISHRYGAANIVFIANPWSIYYRRTVYI